jgi:hypothetical protein
VLHLGRRIGVGHDVGDLLELQRPLKGDRQPDVAAAVEEELRLPVGGGDRLHVVVDALERVLEGAPEPVEHGDDDPVAQPTLNAFDRFEKERAVSAAAGFVELLEDVLKASVVERAPCGDAFPLNGGRDERRA